MSTTLALMKRAWDTDPLWATSIHRGPVGWTFGFGQRVVIRQAAAALDSAADDIVTRLDRMFAEWRPEVCGNVVSWVPPWEYLTWQRPAAPLA